MTRLAMDEVDDEVQLPLDTLELLAQFTAEKDARTKHFEDLKLQATVGLTANDDDDSDTPLAPHTSKLTMDAFGEDWNASQFWFTPSTATALARQLLAGTDASTSIAVVSTPSVYIALRNLLHDIPASSRPQLSLLEIDPRFEVVGPDFVPYDYEHALRLSPALKGAFDRIIVDPPFHSEDCQVKMAVTVRWLARNWVQPTTYKDGVMLMMCTGATLAGVVGKLYRGLGVQETGFEVVHGRGLSNEYRCYANFECEEWKWC